jgi:hypothetical protein
LSVPKTAAPPRPIPVPVPVPAPGHTMTKGQAQEWVHYQLIVVEVGHDEVVAAFTALAERSPGTADRLKGLFRMCCEIVTSSAPSWDGASAAALEVRKA